MTSYGRDIKGSLSLDITNFKANLLSAKTMLAEFQATVNSFNAGIGGLGGTTTDGKTNLGNSQKAMEELNKQIETNNKVIKKNQDALLRLNNQQAKNNRTTNDGSKSQETLRQRLTGVKGQAIMIGGMISQIASQYIIRLIDYTAQLISTSIKARSEMESFLKLMNMVPTQVNSFNQALKRTVKAFPKLKKYLYLK
jgi:peptidoglycan hydrolase CwlO-like protein